MTDLVAARALMALSLGFHIVFAAIGIAMPLLMVIAEARWLRHGRAVHLELAKRWSRGVAILFAVGAVSGTVLSFELGLLWPIFMREAGPAMGLAFSMEGFAFFLEAIFIGIYLYGWTRVRPSMHLASGVVVLVAGALSGIFVVSANGWMNAPTGIEVEAGRIVAIDPVAAMLNPMWIPQALHMLLAAFLAVGFGVAGVHAWMLLRRGPSELHREALGMSLAMGCVAALLLPISGDGLAKRVAESQPVKLAALEGQFETERGAALRIGGWPDVERRETRWAIELPGLLSWLAYGDVDAEVAGLEAFPREDWPPVAAVHLSFQGMVALGGALAALALLAAVLAWRRALFRHRPFLWILVAAAPLGFIAIEAGWMVTELGRQPWVVQGVMRTSEAVTPVTGVWVSLVTFAVLYGILAVIVVRLLARHVFQSSAGEGAPGSAP